MAQAVPKESMVSYELTDAVAVPIYTVAPNRRLGYRFMKRTFDIAASLIGLILLSPLFLIVAAAIYIDDPHASPIFVQTRVGKDGKEFQFFKFRSMVANAESLLETLMERNEMDGPVFKIKEDPRITRVGRIIRRTCIDELPQLWNVLKGDMSLVGPRPPLPREVVQYTPYQRQRLNAKMGIVCYLKILLGTLRVLLKSDGE